MKNKDAIIRQLNGIYYHRGVIAISLCPGNENHQSAVIRKVLLAMSDDKKTVSVPEITIILPMMIVISETNRQVTNQIPIDPMPLETRGSSPAVSSFGACPTPAR